MTCPVLPPLYREDRSDSAPGGSHVAGSTATDLLRFAMVAKLATDLGDPVLARRAARYAVSSAHLLAGLDWQPEAQEDEDDDTAPLPAVDELLEQLRPADDDAASQLGDRGVNVASSCRDDARRGAKAGEVRS